MPILPQELLDHIVDLTRHDIPTLLLLLNTSKAFVDRCRIYIYRHAHLRTADNGELSPSCLALQDLFIKENMGTLVLSLDCRFASKPLPASMSEWTLSMPNLRELTLEGRGFSLDEDSDLDPIMPYPIEIKRISIAYSSHSAEGISRLIRRCPNLTSLTFVHVTRAIWETHTLSSSPYTACISELVLVECDPRFLRLIPFAVSCSNLRRLFLVNLGPRYRGEFAMQKALLHFRRTSANLRFLFLSPPTEYVMESIVAYILDIPHVVLQFTDMVAAKDWLERAPVCKRPFGLVKLDVILCFRQWDTASDKDWTGRVAGGLRPWGVEEFRVIVTDTPQEKVRQDFVEGVRVSFVETPFELMYLEFMDGGVI
ncbi:hypothetical protein BDZ89DRAFT_1073520 [Hymenopellis radicata]|nr:hypothetical protein BDZ89DRAFT_1073520 [Hymenopellis radicata]